MKLVNLTPHRITFVREDGPNLAFEPSGIVARVTATTVRVGDFCGIPITHTVYDEVCGLPDPEEGTVYIVSSIVAHAVPEREDVFIPNESVRDESGRIVGCRSIAHV